MYSIPGQNSRWYGGLNKLTQWRIIIYGCIDGFSSVTFYVVCESNNKASTALNQFTLAIKIFGLPDRNRGARIHNQHIERLYYNTTYCVLSFL